jgi:hypothetical protein
VLGSLPSPAYSRIKANRTEVVERHIRTGWDAGEVKLDGAVILAQELDLAIRLAVPWGRGACLISSGK